jgi:hypothetical protein
MNYPTIPVRHFWNPKQRRPKPPRSKLLDIRKMHLSYMDCDEITEPKKKKR